MGKKSDPGSATLENVPPGTAGVALDHLGEEATHRRLGEQGSAALLSLLHIHENCHTTRAGAAASFISSPN
jgi:hypothetical protein